MLGAILLLMVPFTPAAPSTAGGVVPMHAAAAGGRSTATVAAPPVRLHVFPNRVAAFNVCNPCRYPPPVGRGGASASPLRHVLQIVAEIARYRPQVISLEEICVGEANLVARYLNQLRGLQYHIALGSQVDRKGRCFPFGTAFGNAVLSAAPITDSSNHHYSTPSSEPRGYVELTTTVDGQQDRVVATHLAEKRQGPARQRQARELVGAVAGTFPRTIILGDFNATPNTPEITTVRQAGFHDADPGCNQPPFTACKVTADAGPPRKKFDYIFLNGIASPGIGVHPNPSDHDLVHADLDLGAPLGPPGTFGHSRSVDLPPTVDAGPRRNGAEGSAVRLGGSASDDHGAPTLHWFASPGTTPTRERGAGSAIRRRRRRRSRVTTTARSPLP